MKVDESGWKWMKMDEMDENGWKWMRVDQSRWEWMRMDYIGWQWMKMDESRWNGWKWMKVDESGWNGWKWMKVDSTDIWLLLMLMLCLLAVTPGVTHFGAYHRPRDGHFCLCCCQWLPCNCLRCRYVSCCYLFHFFVAFEGTPLVSTNWHHPQLDLVTCWFRWTKVVHFWAINPCLKGLMKLV